MPRANWKGVISFGLVSIPIELHSVTNKSADISFHQIDKRDNARIRFQRINAETGKEVPWEQVGRGYEYDKELTIPVPDEVLQKVAGENSRVIDITTFINKDEFDILSIDRTYYLVPDKKGEKGYVILREALAGTHKIGIAKVIISTKEYLAAVMPHQDGLLLCLLKYDNEVIKMSELNLPTKDLSIYKVKPAEVEVAKKLIKSMSSKWKPEKYTDDYQTAIHKWVEESALNLPHKLKAKKRPSETKAVDFMQLLKKSLDSSGKIKRKDKTRYKPTLAKVKHAYAHHTKH